MLDVIALEVVGAMISNALLITIGYMFFDRKKKQSLKRVYDRTAKSATRSINKSLDVILDELLAFLYLSRAVTGREVEELVVTKNTIQRADKGEYDRFRNKLLAYLNTDEVFGLMIEAEQVPSTFWLPVFQAVRNLNVETNRYIDIFETTGSFDEIDFLTGLNEKSESIMNRLSLLQHPDVSLAKMGAENLREQLFGELKEFVGLCLEAGKLFKEGELTYKPTIGPR